MLRKQNALWIGLVMLCSCQAQEQSISKAPSVGKASIHLTSTAFAQGTMIPKVYSCDGKKISPPLAWSPVPKGTASLALVCEDPDAPGGTFAHWVLFNFPAKTTQLPEAVPTRKELDNGATQGTNDFGSIGYGAPCPPQGTHRYFFRIYALDSKISLGDAVTRQQLLSAIKGHVLAQGELMGKYSR